MSYSEALPKVRVCSLERAHGSKSPICHMLPRGLFLWSNPRRGEQFRDASEKDTLRENTLHYSIVKQLRNREEKGSERALSGLVLLVIGL